MDAVSIGARIVRAYMAAGLSQRDLAKATGISQATLSRIVAGQRAVKMPEVVAIAWATGVTVGEITGARRVADRALCATRSADGVDTMWATLLSFAELNAYLEDQAIPTS